MYWSLLPHKEMVVLISVLYLGRWQQKRCVFVQACWRAAEGCSS